MEFAIVSIRQGVAVFEEHSDIPSARARGRSSQRNRKGTVREKSSDMSLLSIQLVLKSNPFPVDAVYYLFECRM